MRYRKLIILAGLAVVAILVAVAVRNSITFRFVGTDPADGSKPNQYTAVSFKFNKTLKVKGNGLNQITITPGVAGSTVVSGKSVIFTPNSSFATNVTYTAVLSGVSSVSGKTINGLRISFTPQYFDFADLPKDVQQRLVSQTDTNDKQKTPYSAGVIAIDGADELSNHGVTSQQLDALQIAFYNFFVSKKEQVRGLVLTNVVKQPRNPNNPSEIDTIAFSATLDNKQVFKGKIEYPDLIRLRLLLYNPANGNLIFDSGFIQ